MNGSGHISLRRTSGKQWTLKPQDLAVALELLTLERKWLPYRQLSEKLRLSQYEVNAAVKRLLEARLLAQLDSGPAPVKRNLRDYVLHGAVFSFPPVRGSITIGIPTAHSAAPFKKGLTRRDIPVVWPHPQGDVRGEALIPLYPGLPIVAASDPPLYELLSTFDVLRIGQAREREVARQWLAKRLS